MINKVIIIGRVGKDPETKYTASGNAVSTFSMAVTETWKDSNGEKKEKTEWFTIIAWRKLGEIVGEYVKKGMLVYVEGKLATQKWEKDGQKHERTEIVAAVMKMLTQAKDSNSQSGSNKQQHPQPADDDFIPEEDDDFIPEEDDVPL